jgi:hypothetical protein
VDALDLLFRRLVLAAQAADALERPLDVGELLDTFIPYKSVRRDGKLDTNDDYLHVVMQLVAGERELVFGDDLMQDDLRNELATTNPDLGLLRTYVNAKVRLSSAAIKRVLAGDTDIDLRPPTPVVNVVVTPEIPAPAVVAHPEGAAGGASGGATPPAAEPPSAPRVSTGSPANVTEPEECPYCAQALPSDRAVRYCPSCGINLRIRRCPGCSTEIESEWKFCVTCGRSAA